jgi:hypothetical protein
MPTITSYTTKCDLTRTRVMADTWPYLAGQRQTAHLTCDVRLWWLHSP